MSVARPFYAARILGTPDIPVSVRTDGGRMTFDANRAPHVEGSLRIAIEDPALLEDLDPRDGRRLAVDVYPESHLAAQYSAWVEQRRNLALNPRWGVATFPNTNTTTANPLTKGVVPPIPHPLGIATAGEARSNGTTSNLATIYATDGITNVGSPTRWIGLSVMVTEAGYRLSPSWGGQELTPWEWVIVLRTSPIAAGAWADFGVQKISGVCSTTVRAYITGTIASLTPISDYFDGGTEPAGELQRTRWLGAANASASVLETRSLTGWEQVPDGAPRSFNLGLREVNPDRGAATVQCALASDEAILEDHRPLAGLDMIQYANDVHALAEAVISTALGTPTTVAGGTGSVYPLWEVTNLLPNPTGASGVGSWHASTGATNLTAVTPPVAAPLGVTAVRWRTGNGASIVQPGGWDGVDAKKVANVTPGKQYTASIYLLSSSARNATIRLAFRDENGTTLPGAVYSAAPVMTSTTVWKRLSITAIPPKLARYAYIVVDTAGNVDGQLHYGTLPMLTEGPFLSEPFTGATPNTADYTYTWAEAANASASIRTPARNAPDRDALYWPAGTSALEFIAPLVQVLGLRLVCNELRSWSLRDESFRAAGEQTYRAGVNIVDVSEEISRDSDQWFQGAVFRYRWTDRDDIEQTRDDTYVLSGVTNPKVILREIRSAYPGPGRAEYAVRRAQGRGRTVTASRQAKWDEAADQPLTALLEGTEIQTGTASKVEFNLAENTVTTTARTTDTPPSAWQLIPAGQAWLDSPVGASWIGEVI